MDKGHLKLRQRALDRYYANPKLCLNCGTVIRVKEGNNPTSLYRQKYCSHHCAAVCTNKLYPKRHTDRTTICTCGGKKDIRAERCHKCKRFNSLAIVEAKPISVLFNKGNARIKYSQIRGWATDAMILWKIPKRCIVCGFDTVVQVHHIRGIATFNANELLGVVNSKSNLCYLCPNHHVMVSRGLIKLTNTI